MRGCWGGGQADATPRLTSARLAPTGDVQRGWQLFLDHCVECHGEQRRGDGDGSRRTLKQPADLRDPILLASRTDDDLARVITLGGSLSGKSRSMPAFALELSERDVMDLIALLRGDSIHLEDCFPEATHYARASDDPDGPPVLAAYAIGPRTFRPKVLGSGEPLPPGAKKLGLVMFAELSLPKAGPTPVAFLAHPDGRIHGLRVALPPPYNERAQADLEATLIERIPRLPELTPLLDAGAERLARVAAKVPGGG